MAPALPRRRATGSSLGATVLFLQALHLRGPRNGPRTPPAAGNRFELGRNRLVLQSSSSAGAQKWPPHSPGGGQPVRAWAQPSSSSKLVICGGPELAPALARRRA